MHRLPQSPERDVPDVLSGSVKTIGTRFIEKALEVSSDTQAICYACLHKNEVYSRLEEQQASLLPVIARLERTERAQFQWLMDQGSPIGYFAALFQLLVAGLRELLKQAFGDLWQVGQIHQSLIEVDFGVWSVEQTHVLLRDFLPHLELWMKWSCSKPDWDNDEDEEILLREKWRAPRFLSMNPEVYMPSDDAVAWQLHESEASRAILRDILITQYEVPLLRAIDSWLGDARLLLAKTPRSSPDATKPADGGDLKKATSGKYRKPLSRLERERRQAIFGAIQNNQRGARYCSVLDSRKVPIPEQWRDAGCPETYSQAYKDATWRQRIQDEKYRFRQRYNGISPAEREAIIDGTGDTRRTRH